MKVEDIRAWDDAEIQARLQELGKEQFKLRFQSSVMEIENPSLLGRIRKDIARLKTVLRERELGKGV